MRKITSLTRKELIVIVFFILAFYIRINVNGIYLNNPGNLKAADAIYHSLMAEGIAEGYPIAEQAPYMAQNLEHVINIVPPHTGTITGALIALTGQASWNLYNIVICLLSAFSVLIIYLLGKHVFNEEIGLLASGLMIIPFNFGKWYYLLSIGIWPNSAVFTFLLFSVLLAYLYHETRKEIYLFLTGITAAAVFQTHFSELLLIFLPFLYLVFLIVIEKKNLVTKLAYLGALPFLVLLISIPNLLSWDVGSASTFALNFGLDIPDYIPQVGDFGIVYGLLSLYALVQIFLNRKKYSLFIIYILFLAVFLYILPYFLSNPYYMTLRPRDFTLFFLVILSSYAVYHLLKIVIPQKYHLTSILALIFIATILAYPKYAEFSKQVDYQNIPEIRYEAYRWIIENTPDESFIYYYAMAGQKIENMMKRPGFTVDFSKLSATLSRHNLSQGFPLEYEGEWYQASSVDPSYRTGLFSFEKYPYKETPSVLDLDYIYFENSNEQIAQLNYAVAQYLIDEHGFIPVFNNDFAWVLLNANKGTV
jgi:hypothetical protein